MSHPQVPYDPLLDPNTGNPSSTYHSPEGTPRIMAQNDTDFGLPVPHFHGSTNRGSTYSSSTLGGEDRQSGYGSIAALKDNTYRDAESPRAGHAYPPGTDPSTRAYRDETSHGQRGLNEKQELYEAPRSKSKRKGVFWAALCCALIVIVLAVALPVYFLVVKPKSGSGTSSPGNSGNTNGGGNTSNSPGGNSQQILTTGGDGSVVTKSDGTTFVYNNTFGGYWVYDINNPLNNSARPQSYTPPLSEPWKFGVDQIYGVNLGGWLNLEPFISPALYEPFYPNAVDEYTLSTLIMARDGNLDAIAHHYETFIVEEDFAQIAAAGLNWVRIPLPFWAIETYPGEPFLPKTSWTYFLKAIEWARKYGLRINLDFHAVPGSQNGWNHSGKLGDMNFLKGVMGVANAQRALDYIRILAEFISQPEYRDVVPFFGILNEPRGGEDLIPKVALRSFYAEAYRIIRTAGGSGAGNGPVMSIHEGFFGLADWPNVFAGADRIALDTHPYLIFDAFPAGNPSDFAAVPCTNWANTFGSSMSAFGITTAGEWSHAINDCGLYFNDVGKGTRYEGTFPGFTTRLGDCAQWNDYSTWDASIKTGLRDLSASTMDALGDWFFWTWRIGEALSGKVETPFWSYKLAIQEGWAVLDPRTSKGQCQRLGAQGNSFYASGGTYSGAQVGAGVVDAIAEVPSLSSFNWPPTAVGLFANAAALPTYAATGPIPTLPVPGQPSAPPSQPTPTGTTNFGNGWANGADTGLMHVPIPGCAYPNGWDANTAAVPVC